MLDPEFGHGNTPAKGERSRKLRQAISMAIDREEYSKMVPQARRPGGGKPGADGHLRFT